MRTLQDLLAERRANVLELSRERDRVARELLRFHVLLIDREITELTGDDSNPWELRS